MGDSITFGTTVRPSYSALLREPTSWAAIAAIVGTTVALAGTLSWLAWENTLSTTSGPIPVPPWLASWAPPLGDLLAMLSLLGAYRLLERRSWAAMVGCVLLLLRLAAYASFVLYSALWMPGQLPASVGLPFIPFLLLQGSLWLGPAATLLLALSGLFSEGNRRLGVVLLGLGLFGQPLVFAYEILPGEGFYLSGATVLLLGWPSGGINLPEAALFALLALLLLRLQGGGPPRPRGARGSGSFMLCSGFGRQSTPMAPWRSQWGPPAKLRRELCRATDQAHHPPPLRRLDEPIR